MRLLSILVAALLVTACAQTGGSASRMVIDWEEVDRVERAHRAAGNASEVIWVNYPKRRVTVDESSDADNAEPDQSNPNTQPEE